MKKVKRWFAKGGGVSRAGPFKSDVEAAKAMTLVDGGKPEDFAIWPEMIDDDSPSVKKYHWTVGDASGITPTE